jgi:hypothetical protein
VILIYEKERMSNVMSYFKVCLDRLRKTIETCQNTEAKTAREHMTTTFRTDLPMLSQFRDHNAHFHSHENLRPYVISTSNLQAKEAVSMDMLSEEGKESNPPAPVSKCTLLYTNSSVLQAGCPDSATQTTLLTSSNKSMH